jgi:hypothetical protein
MLVLLALQDRAAYHGMLEKQLGKKNAFKSYWVSSWSLYGILAKDCKSLVKDATGCINSATSSKLEGGHPPFCYPYNHFGPEMLFLMWNREYTEFHICFCQAKFITSLN